MTKRTAIWVSLAIALAAPCIAEETALLGHWRGSDGLETIDLVFTSQSITYDGEAYGYVIAENILYIEDTVGSLPFPFSLQGGILAIDFSVMGGSLVQFKRVSDGANERTTPQPPRRGEATPGERQSETGVASLQAGELGDPSWGFVFRLPAGWQPARGDDMFTLVQPGKQGAVFILNHALGSIDEIQQQFVRGFQSDEYQLALAGESQRLGDDMLAADFEGAIDGSAIHARCIGTVSPFSGGAYVVAAAGPGQLTPELGRVAEQIARSVRYMKVDGSALWRDLAGHWEAVASQTRRLWLEVDGTFEEYSEFVASGALTDGYEQTGTWGVANNNANAGRWSAQGTKERGTILLQYDDGRQKTLDYRVWVERGTTYWKEYDFNGVRYLR